MEINAANPQGAPLEQPPVVAGTAGTASKEAGQFKIPDKFQGKTPEDIAKAYVELESQYGKVNSRVGELDRYKKLGELDKLEPALEWARNQYQLVRDGKVKYIEDA